MIRYGILILLLLVGCKEVVNAQTKPSPTPIRWIVVKPPVVETVSYTLTAPTMDNVGDCSMPILQPASAPMVIRWRWSGPNPGMGYMPAMPGDTARFAVATTAESLWVWAERQGAMKCDTVVVVSP